MSCQWCIIFIITHHSSLFSSKIVCLHECSSCTSSMYLNTNNTARLFSNPTTHPCHSIPAPRYFFASVQSIVSSGTVPSQQWDDAPVWAVSVLAVAVLSLQPLHAQHRSNPPTGPEERLVFYRCTTFDPLTNIDAESTDHHHQSRCHHPIALI